MAYAFGFSWFPRLYSVIPKRQKSSLIQRHPLGMRALYFPEYLETFQAVL